MGKKNNAKELDGNLCFICNKPFKNKEPKYVITPSLRICGNIISLKRVSKNNKEYWGPICIPCYIKEHEEIISEDEKEALLNLYNKFLEVQAMKGRFWKRAKKEAVYECCLEMLSIGDGYWQCPKCYRICYFSENKKLKKLIENIENIILFILPGPIGDFYFRLKLVYWEIIYFKDSRNPDKISFDIEKSWIKRILKILFKR